MSNLDTIVDLINSRFEAQDKFLEREFKGVHARLGRVETQTTITNGRVTALEQAGITKEAVKTALEEAHETHEAVIKDEQKDARDKTTLRLNKWQTAVAIILGAIVLLGSVVGYVEIIAHHVR